MNTITAAPPRPVHPLAYALPLAALIMVIPALAHAHAGDHAGAAFGAGLVHPIGGADHVLAMVTVGLWAAITQGRAVWAMPLGFVAAMVVGGVLGMKGIALPGLEPAILASVMVLGAAVALALRPHLAVTVALIAVFGVAHGNAHGIEATSGIGFAAGFVISSVALHLIGLAAGLGLRRAGQARLSRGLGAGAAVAGLALAFG